MAKETHTSMRTVNLEAGHPTTMQALVRMNQALSSARTNVGVLKLIHGYGSSGKGGAIRQAVLEQLQRQKAQGIIREFVPGEEFSPFSASGRKALALIPELSRDKDYARGNKGITLVLF